MTEQVGHPVAGVDYPRTYQQLLEWFAEEGSCLDYLAALRWPGGFVCPGCAGTRSWRTGAGAWMCSSCARKTTVTAGTIFHRTRTPLTTWFAAIWLVTSQKSGVSALELQRVLGFGSYETAWAWLHKLRRAMVRPDRDLLGGPGKVVEVDETMVGGVTAGTAGAGSDKIPVMIAVERPGAASGGRPLGRVRMSPTTTPGTRKLVDFAATVVAPGSMIRTDGARFLRRLGTMGYTHEYTIGIGHPDQESLLPGVHLSASLLKRWLTGTLHYAAAETHLGYYLDEFTFRFNRRSSASRGLLFYRLLEQAVDTAPHPLASLRARAAAT